MPAPWPSIAGGGYKPPQVSNIMSYIYRYFVVVVVVINCPGDEKYIQTETCMAGQTGVSRGEYNIGVGGERKCDELKVESPRDNWKRVWTPPPSPTTQISRFKNWASRQDEVEDVWTLQILGSLTCLGQRSLVSAGIWASFTSVSFWHLKNH